MPIYFYTLLLIHKMKFPPFQWCISSTVFYFPAEILLIVMELLTWTSEISWCMEHIGPLKMYKHMSDWTARPCPQPVSPTHGRPRLRSLCPAQTASLKTAAEARQISFQHAWTFCRRASRLASLSSRIHRSVTYFGPPVVVVVVVGWGALTHEGSGGWDLMFWWMYSSHWTSAILRSHLKKINYTDFSFFSCRALSHFKSSIVLKWQQTNFMSCSELWTELKPVLPFSLSRLRTCATTRAEDLH